MLKSGLYEQVINCELGKKLDEFANEFHSETALIDEAEASKILAKYVAEIIEKGFDNVVDNGGDIKSQIDLANKIVSMITTETKESIFEEMKVDERAKQLLALVEKKNTVHAINNKFSVVRPATSIAHSSLFTGAQHEPQMYTELKKEIVSADRVDMLVSFIKWSGLRLIIDELRDFTQKGGELRIITTSYMGATDVKAIEELRKLPNTKIKVSYNTKNTRLHAKAYVFYRETGFSTAYVGSSNLSNAALTSGLEWNTKVTQKDLPETIKKIIATFEFYWNDKEFEYYSESEKERLTRALKIEKYPISNDSNSYTIDVTPYSYQQEILDKLDAERAIRGYMRNLLVAATGTGKTVISALDYKHFRKKNSDKPCRLLFVAHREEILLQSRNTFRAVLKDANFGEMFVGNNRPNSLDYLFISIQTFNSQNFTEKTKADFYDYIIVDEFHHAAAPTYQKLLEFYQPSILLGLTATPERMDGKSILSYFNNRIAAEIRLPEAIDRKLLCPFQYFGVTDSVDLQGIKWSAGGYDKAELSNIYSLNEHVANKRADLIIGSLLKYVTDIDNVKGLGFCVSVDHAKFMSSYFNTHNIPSMFLTGASSDEDRKAAKDYLVSGKIRFIFVVDIYNEGVDIPEVNTILFLRPTESLTVFLQQLGRGLRLAEDKECLTVLDFIGQAHKKYNFEQKFVALLSNTTRNITREIHNGFINVPKGCYIQLEKVAREYILKNIRASYGNKDGLITRIASFEEDTGLTLTLKNFLDYHHLEPKNIYKFASFSRLCANAEVIKDFKEPLEDFSDKIFYRFSSIDSRRWIKFILHILPNLRSLNLNTLTDLEKRMLQMFYVTIWDKAITNWKDNEVTKNFNSLIQSPTLLAELIDLLQYQYERIDFIDEPVNLGFDCPLDLHCTYSRDQILVAMDFMKPSSVREGVKWLPEKMLDIFFVTLNKSEKDYSPDTMYNDYSINEELFHWQSQHTTSANSPTGLRYISHKSKNNKILLFVREFKKDLYEKTASYTFLGTVNYVQHNGSSPMNIIWKLDRPIPAKYLKKTNKLVVG